MSSRAVRIVGYTFIGVVIATCSVLVLATALEYTGLSKKLNRQWFAQGQATPESNLYETDYYGKPLDDDPYRLFKVQHLHPYYLFSLPWRPEDIERANNEFVVLHEPGFRNSGVPDSAATAILLGGSTAFGLASTGDSHTLAYRLSELTEYKFANRNSPSWNSHQELVAAAKFPHSYKLSVSFSLANDIQSYCYEFGRQPLHRPAGKLRQARRLFQRRPRQAPRRDSQGGPAGRALPANHQATGQAHGTWFWREGQRLARARRWEVLPGLGVRRARRQDRAKLFAEPKAASQVRRSGRWPASGDTPAH